MIKVIGSWINFLEFSHPCLESLRSILRKIPSSREEILFHVPHHFWFWNHHKHSKVPMRFYILSMVFVLSTSFGSYHNSLAGFVFHFEKGCTNCTLPFNFQSNWSMFLACLMIFGCMPHGPRTKDFLFSQFITRTCFIHSFENYYTAGKKRAIQQAANLLWSFSHQFDKRKSTHGCNTPSLYLLLSHTPLHLYLNQLHQPLVKISKHEIIFYH